MANFKAFWVEDKNDTYSWSIIDRNTDDLEDKGVLIRVQYAALNFKDALSAKIHKGITKKYPHTPGIDAAGFIESSSDSRFKKGDAVLVTGHDLGMNTNGGFGGYINVPASWVVPMPNGLNTETAMILGTGAFTTGLALYQMELNGQNPEMGAILVTGSTGGVGSMAVNILSKAGYDVIAATGKMNESDYLTKLGAKKIIHRDDVSNLPNKAMISTQWAGVIDTIGGSILEGAIRATGMYGNIAVCGLVSSADYCTTVYPQIIRGINILGVASAETPMPIKLKIWEKLSKEWKPNFLDEIKQVIALEQLGETILQMLDGKTKGRIIVKHF